MQETYMGRGPKPQSLSCHDTRKESKKVYAKQRFNPSCPIACFSGKVGKPLCGKTTRSAFTQTLVRRFAKANALTHQLGLNHHRQPNFGVIA